MISSESFGAICREAQERGCTLHASAGAVCAPSRIAGAVLLHTCFPAPRPDSFSHVRRRYVWHRTDRGGDFTEHIARAVSRLQPVRAMADIYFTLTGLRLRQRAV